MSGAARARILQRAALLLRERNDELAELETRDTGKPIQETRVVDVVSGAECFEYFAGLAAQSWPASTSISAATRSATRGASRSAWSPASAHGIIRCRSPAGNRRRRSPAAMR